MSTEHSCISGAEDVPAIAAPSNTLSLVNSQSKDFVTNLPSPSEDRMFVCMTLAVEDESTLLINDRAELHYFPENFLHWDTTPISASSDCTSNELLCGTLQQSLNDAPDCRRNFLNNEINTASNIELLKKYANYYSPSQEYLPSSYYEQLTSDNFNQLTSNDSEQFSANCSIEVVSNISDQATSKFEEYNIDAENVSSDEDRMFTCMTLSVEEENTSLNNLAEHTDNFFPLNFSHLDTTPIISSTDSISNEFQNSLCKNSQSLVDSAIGCKENFLNDGRNIDPCMESASKFANYSFPSLESFPSNTSDCSNQVKSINSDQTPNFEISLDGASSSNNATLQASPQSTKDFKTEHSMGEDEDIKDVLVLLEKMKDYSMDNISFFSSLPSLMLMEEIFLRKGAGIDEVRTVEGAQNILCDTYDEERRKSLIRIKEFLNQELELMKYGDEDYKQEVKQNSVEHETNQDRIIKELQSFFNENFSRTIKMPSRCKMENGSYKALIKWLKKVVEHTEFLRQIKQKDRELKVYHSDVAQLQNELIDIYKPENDKKRSDQTLCAETRTVSSVLLNDAACAVSEVERIKKERSEQ